VKCIALFYILIDVHKENIIPSRVMSKVGTGITLILKPECDSNALSY
jgi:hypothetical protein